MTDKLKDQADIDKWAAEQCGVGFTYDEFKVVVAWWTGDIDDRVYRNYDWTIQDPRCREIFIQEKIDSVHYLRLNSQQVRVSMKPRDMEYVSSIEPTYAAGEIACITAIWEAMKDE